MKVIDLFCGIGGFHYGLKQANKDFEFVWANDIDKYASQVYKKHFPETEYFQGDIKTINADRIPSHDLLCAGFPCQSFSIAGKRKGFDDTRGTLFFEIARILEAKRPSLVLLENVKGLLSHDNGRTLATILRILGELGYWYEFQVLNSKDFSVPQNRERIFIIGHLRTKSRQTIFPLTKNDRIPVETHQKSKNIAQALTATDYKGVSKQRSNVVLEQIVGGTQGQRIYSSNGLAKTLAGEAGGQGAKTGLYAIPVLTPDRQNKRQNGRRFKEAGEEMFTLTGQDIHGIAFNPRNFDGKNYVEGAQTIGLNQPSGNNQTLIKKGMQIRRLTPLECERLQAFPDCWTEPLSDTQRYKCLGNAVTTTVIKAIGNAIIEAEK